MKLVDSKMQDLLLKKDILIESLKTYEAERLHLISTFKEITVPVDCSNTDEEIKKVSESIKTTINRLIITPAEDSRNIVKKCRYHNRGYCKFKDNCRFLHSQVICGNFLENQVCRTRQCQNRHPKDCRYWTENPEGCIRQDSCQYLHLTKRRFRSEKAEVGIETEIGGNCESENTTGKEKNYGNYCESPYDSEETLIRHMETTHQYTCDECDFSAKNKGWLTRHKNSNHAQPSEQIYKCDECDYQSSIERHVNSHINDFHSDNHEDLQEQESVDITATDPNILYIPLPFPINFGQPLNTE